MTKGRNVRWFNLYSFWAYLYAISLQSKLCFVWFALPGAFVIITIITYYYLLSCCIISSLLWENVFFDFYAFRVLQHCISFESMNRRLWSGKVEKKNRLMSGVRRTVCHTKHKRNDYFGTWWIYYLLRFLEYEIDLSSNWNPELLCAARLNMYAHRARNNAMCVSCIRECVRLHRVYLLNWICVAFVQTKRKIPFTTLAFFPDKNVISDWEVMPYEAMECCLATQFTILHGASTDNPLPVL